MILKNCHVLFILLVFLLKNIASQNWKPSCTNPEGNIGVCIPIRECPPLVNIILTLHESEPAMQFVRNSKCGFDGNNPLVCCINNNNNVPINEGIKNQPVNNPYDNGYNNPPGYDNNNNTADENLLPADCGRDLSLRIVGGEKTQLDEFPWMTLLEYTKPTGKTTSCGGALISRRYVLTAAHCIVGKDLPKSWSLKSVRLGEYDTQTNPDCISDGYNSVVCAPPIVNVDIEQTIVHENYLPTNKHQINDIALLRLSRDVEFTHYIKPICLPNSENIASTLWVAGWGKTENRSESNIKLKLSLPLSSRNKCERIYSSHGINLRGSQICAGSEKGKDTCRGDSGGPLMSVERTANNIARWSVVGIVSFGPHPCGMPEFSGVYTKVWDFTDWIRRNMRP